MTPKRETSGDYGQRQNTYDEPDQQQPPPATETAFRSSSPPLPALKNKGKKAKAKAPPVQPPSFDDDNGELPMNSSPPIPPLQTNDDYMQQKTPTPPENAMRISHGQQTYRKPPTPGQPGLFQFCFLSSHSNSSSSFKSIIDFRCHISKKETTTNA